MDNSINKFMSYDHDRLDDIFIKFVKNRGKKSPQMKQLFTQFKQGLEQHIVWEEEILFPLFEEKTGMLNMGPTEVMRIEHKEIKKILKEILNNLNKNNFATKPLEKQLLEILSGHNDKEEMILYPAIDDSLDHKEKQKTLSSLK